MKQNFIGTGVALVTPFDRKGSIDYKALDLLVEHVIRGGVEYLVVLGTTGESATISHPEKKKLLSFITERASGRSRVVLGVGGNNTSEVVQQLSQFDFSKVDFVLSVSPYYNKPTQEGIFRHFKAVAKVSPRPLIIYNVPGRTGSNINAQTTLRLAQEVRNIEGIKEASGNLPQIMEILNKKPEHFQVISGDDNLTYPMMALGASGVISVVGQAYPRACSTMVRLCLGGRFEEARTLHYFLYDFTNLLFADGSPGGIKAALSAMKICKPYLRLPLVQVNKGVQSQIEAFVKNNPE
jgi:4-hydroxy-tetrahydrodipicolinate synthase